MRIVVLGDIHGRDCWKLILEREQYDLAVFLGDYVSTHEDISEEVQISNLQEILEYKKSHNVILLRGNHDMQHCGYSWAECSGLFPEVCKWLTGHRDEFLEATQWIHIQDDILFAHAGVSQVWLNNNEIGIPQINDQKPCEMFGFTPDSMWDWSGESKTQPPTWIRPRTLLSVLPEGYIQVVGHTPVKEISRVNDIWVCDRLPIQYLVIDTLKKDRFEVKNIDNSSI